MADDNARVAPHTSSNLARSSVVVGTMTMLSRILGLLRDIVIATCFGASENADAFFVAFKIEAISASC